MEAHTSRDATPPEWQGGELGAIDRLDLQLGEQHREAYRTASPWPHVVIDDLFDPAVVAQARAEELGPGLQLVPRRSNRGIKAESQAPAGPTAGAILQRLLADDVCDMLSTLTGIPDLVTDPTHWWGGVHVLGHGSFQAVHRDFAHDSTGDLWHRVNVLVYLNPGWRSEWGGQLELWDTAMTACHQRIEPTGGRVTIFEPGPDALHGIPTPVRCPIGDARLTLASYFYTADPVPTPVDTTRRWSACRAVPARASWRRSPSPTTRCAGSGIGWRRWRNGGVSYAGPARRRHPRPTRRAGLGRLGQRAVHRCHRLTRRAQLRRQ